jgi:hypothetical protein
LENVRDSFPSKAPINYRGSAIFSGPTDDSQRILSPKDEQALVKKLEEEMNKSLEEALRKNVIIILYIEIELFCFDSNLGLRCLRNSCHR